MKTLNLTTTLAALVITGPAWAQFSFSPTTSISAGTEPSGLAAADLDGDNDRDLATTVDGPDRIVILVNDGFGGYTAGAPVFLPASSSPQDIIAGNFTDDMIMDLAVAVRDPQGAVILMRGTGGGAFVMAGSTTVGDRPRGLSAADADGDGDLDIAVANRDSNSASMLMNNGAGVFTATELAVGGETRDTTIADLDGDGDGDLAVTNSDGRSVAIFTNTLANFAPSATLSVAPFVRPDGVAAGDLDNDGNVDLVVATSDATLGINEAAVFLSDGKGGFVGPTRYATGGTNTSGVAIADFDCDGVLDIATTNQDSNDASVLRNNGAGVFGAAQLLAAGTTPDDPEAADLDGDGDADLATANRDSNDVSVMINDTCTCIEDISGNGSIGFADLTVVLSDWGPCSPGFACRSDLDGSGSVGFGDLTKLLAAWGACP